MILKKNMMEPKRIFDLLSLYKLKFKPKDDVLAAKENGNWRKYSIDEYIVNANNVSYALLKLGIKKGDNIASISNNRPEWNFIDIGIQQIGAVHTPIYPTISESDYKYILNHAEVKLIFISSNELLTKIKHIFPDVPTLKEIYTFNEIEGEKHFSKLIELGKNNPEKEKLKKIKDSIKSNDIATLIYTSGTTGNPKGVMLSHNNLLSNTIAVSYIPTFGEEGKALSFLPLCHVYERMINYLYQYLGISIYYAQNMSTIADDAKEIKPDMMTAVPRFLEKVYDKILNKGRMLKGIKKGIFFWAVRLAENYELNHENGWWYEFNLKIADKLVLSKWREALGGNFKIIVSGGAAIQPRLSRVFWSAKLPVYEGYGLTETSPVIAVTSTDENGIKFGTVGPPLRGVKVKIADDGEVLCKSPGVMLGYYRDEKMTNEVIDKDGWFHTGDVGVFEKEGQLHLTGRKKEIFKTSVGKYIAPQIIENKLKESPFIDNAMVIGENQKFAAALIVPNFEHLCSWCNIKKIKYTGNEEIIKDYVIRKRYQREIEKYNKELGNAEKIRKFRFVDTVWSVETGELSATLKLKRNIVFQKYQYLADEIFQVKQL